jgi:membrane associated rhomboid family serine protease
VTFEAGLVPFLITAIMLWMFGNQVERRMGTQRFLGLYLGSAFLGNLAACLWTGGPFWVAMPMGSGYSIGALFVAFGHFHRNMDVLFMFLFKVNAWNLVFYGLGLNLLFFLLQGQGHFLGLFLAALGSLLYLTQGRNMGGPLGHLEAQIRSAYARGLFKWKTRHLKVMPGGKKEDPWIRDKDPDHPGGPVIH